MPRWTHWCPACGRKKVVYRGSRIGYVCYCCDMVWPTKEEMIADLEAK